jgi:hypothetical protein
MLDQLSQIFGTNNPMEIVQTARAQKDAVADLQTDLERVTKEKAAITEKHTLYVQDQLKKEHKIRQYLDMARVGAVQFDVDELIDGIALKNKSLVEMIAVEAD